MCRLLGERIREQRKLKDFTQRDLAKNLNVTYQTVSKYELGINIPDADMLLKLSDILECSTDYLVGKVNSPSVQFFEYQDKELGKIELGMDNYPYKLTPAEVEEMVKKLKEYHFDVDALIEDMRKEEENK